jgi:hypothetical protein
MQRVEFNRYNLELYVAIAQLYRQNLEMLKDLSRLNSGLQTAHAAASKSDAAGAIAALDRCLALADDIKQQRNRAFSEAVTVWYKSWYPRVAEANGRHFVNQVDDVKDHLPVRTVDMSYLIYRQLLYPLGDWASQCRRAATHMQRLIACLLEQ